MSWEQALADPHLMQLGVWLERQLGEKEMAKLQAKGWSMKDLEHRHLQGDYRAERLKLVMVKDPNCRVRPFVELWVSKAGSHAACPMSKGAATNSDSTLLDDRAAKRLEVLDLSEDLGRLRAGLVVNFNNLLGQVADPAPHVRHEHLDERYIIKEPSGPLCSLATAQGGSGSRVGWLRPSGPQAASASMWSDFQACFHRGQMST
jgi:hypothetical protein